MSRSLKDSRWRADDQSMSDTAVLALNLLNTLTGGTPVMVRHAAPEPRPSRRQAADPAPNRTKVDAPKCPHGHFERWARRHCKPCTL